MKKLYRKGTVHPSPPLVSDHLSFLPATILTLAVALSPQDREALAYLISCSSSSFSSSSCCSSGSRRSTSSINNNNSNNNAGGSARRTTNADHPASFNCYCFGCYMSYWVRWDSSPNRQLIHEIIEAYEDGLSAPSKKEKSRKERRKNNKGSTASGHGQITNSSELATSNSTGSGNKEFTESENSVKEVLGTEVDSTRDGDDGMEDEVSGKGTSVRRFVGFLGEKIWGIWT